MAGYGVFVDVGASISGLRAAMADGYSVVRDAVQRMNGEFSGFGDAGSGAATKIGSAMGSVGGIMAGVAASFAAVAAAWKAARLVEGFAELGIQTNSTIETARLGIASLITAQTQLSDSTGRTLTGAAALDAAMMLATDQVQKLRIAGLETAATTPQLIEAFQASVAAGLSAGLTLDQVRKITVLITQAAGAMGVPMNMLRQESTSILRATIDRNSVVAKALQIDNEDIKLWREKGILAEELVKRLAPFEEAGKRVAQSWAGVTSNLEEAKQVLSADITTGLFASLKSALNDALSGAFDTAKATVSTSFEGIVSIGQEAFGAIGDLARGAINSAVEGAKTLSSWFAANRDRVGEVIQQAKLLAGEIGGSLVDIIKVVGQVAAWLVQTRILAAALAGVAGIVAVIRDTFTVVWEVVKTIGLGIYGWLAKPLAYLIELLGTVANAVGMKGLGQEMAKVSAAWKAQSTDAFNTIESGWTSLFEKIRSGKTATQELWDTINNPPAQAFENLGPSPLTPNYKPNPTPPDTKDTSGTMLAQWKSELDELKLLEESKDTWSLEEEQRFWQEKLALTTRGTKAYAGVIKELLPLQRAIDKQDHDERLAVLSTQLEDARQNGVERIALARGIWQEEVREHGEGSAQAAAAYRRLLQVERDVANERAQVQIKALEARQARELAALDLDEKEVRNRAELGIISAKKEVEQLRAIEDEKYQIRLKGALEQAALETDPAKRQADLDRIGQIEAQHAQRVADINQQAALVVKQRWQSVFDAMSSSFASAIAGMIKGTQSFGQAMRNVLASMVDFFVQMVAQMLARWIAGKIMEKLVGKSAAASSITAGAGVAAVNAMASVAAIPFVGWAMAPGVFATTLALGLSALGTLASAAGGYDIPAGLNPVAQLHAREMVLPAKYADAIRGMAEGDGGGGISVTYAPSLTSWDGADARRMLDKHADVFVAKMEEWVRNGRRR